MEAVFCSVAIIHVYKSHVLSLEVWGIDFFVQVLNEVWKITDFGLK